MISIRRAGLGAVLAMCLAAGWSQGADSRVMKTYPLYTLDATPLISMVETVLGPDGRVIYDRPNGRLLVLAAEDDQTKVAEIMQELNVPPVNVRVEIAIEESNRQQLQGVGVSGSGEVIIQDGDATGSGTIKPHLENRSGKRARNTKQTLLLQSGTDAILSIGEAVPYAEWLVDYGVGQGFIAQDVNFREVGAVLRVQARVIGNGPLISLKLTPELTGQGDAGPQSVAFTRLSSDVTVQDGQTLDLGGLSENNEFYEKFLVGVDRSGNQRALTIRVTPHIEQPSGQPVAAPSVPTMN